MSAYKYGEEIVEAIQWNATMDCWRELMKMGFEWYPGEMGTDTFYVRRINEKIKVKKGDWVVKTDRAFIVMDDVYFNQKYVKLSN